MSRPTRGRAHPLPVRGCHPLWPAFPDDSGSDTRAAGLIPFRSPLLGESRLMSFPPATEMFQFAGFASTVAGRYRFRGGLPHSEIFGSQGAPPSPKLFAGCHVLRRLSVPRHPPNALTYRSRTSRSPCADTHASEHGNRAHTYTHGRRLPGDGKPGTGSRDILPTRRLTPTPGIEDPLQHPTIRIPPSPPKETTGRSPVAKTLFTLSKNQMSDDRCQMMDTVRQHRKRLNEFRHFRDHRRRPSDNRHPPSVLRLVEPIGVEPTTS